jgi:hypothetical protein
MNMGGEIYCFPEKYRERVRIERALSRSDGHLFSWVKTGSSGEKNKGKTFLWGLYIDEEKDFFEVAHDPENPAIPLWKKTKCSTDSIVEAMKIRGTETNEWALYALGVSTNPPGTSENKLLAFPGVALPVNPNREESEAENERIEKPRPKTFSCPPGSPMPPGIPDFRRQLQRDGLILVSYYREFYSRRRHRDSTKIERAHWCAVWVTASGKGMRLYRTSAIINERDAETVRPDEASSIDEAIHGNYENAKYLIPYIVHVAPGIPVERPNGTVMIQDLRRLYVEAGQRIWPSIDYERIFRLTDEKKKETEAKRIRRAKAITWNAKQEDSREG